MTHQRWSKRESLHRRRRASDIAREAADVNSAQARKSSAVSEALAWRAYRCRTIKQNLFGIFLDNARGSAVGGGGD